MQACHAVEQLTPTNTTFFREEAMAVVDLIWMGCGVSMERVGVLAGFRREERLYRENHRHHPLLPRTRDRERSVPVLLAS
jgi:hypothetical protein